MKREEVTKIWNWSKWSKIFYLQYMSKWTKIFNLLYMLLRSLWFSAWGAVRISKEIITQTKLKTRATNGNQCKKKNQIFKIYLQLFVKHNKYTFQPFVFLQQLGRALFSININHEAITVSHNMFRNYTAHCHKDSSNIQFNASWQMPIAQLEGPNCCQKKTKKNLNTIQFFF